MKISNATILFAMANLASTSHAFGGFDIHSRVGRIDRSRMQSFQSINRQQEQEEMERAIQSQENTFPRQNHDHIVNGVTDSSRRQALAASLVGLGVLTSSLSLVGAAPEKANALERTFPDELTELDPKEVRISTTARLNSQQRATVAQEVAKKRQTLYTYNIKEDGLPSLLWGGALWLLSGSRSNPLTTPLANIIYDPNEEEWLRDRNAGLFAAPPAPLLILLGFIFICLGVVTEFILLQLAEGDIEISLQLAGVALLNGGFIELGRIASGEKRDTREENDRNVQLQREFQEFAEKRLIQGGNCHRNDVVRSFRRYFAKYRQRDSEEYPLTDLEIEQLLRSWNKVENFGRAEMTSAGFYYGIQINKDADVFA